MAENNDWDYVDQSRNWGWNCVFGKEQSPININSSTFSSINIQDRYSLRFRYNVTKKNPAIKIEIDSKKFIIEVSDLKKESFGEVVIANPDNPNTHIS
jgi:carbonic anhydrase